MRTRRPRLWRELVAEVGRATDTTPITAIMVLMVVPRGYASNLGVRYVTG